jgi:YgiT-type zinc finger domain-containing protein
MKRHNSSYDYGECHVCSEQMEERRIKQEFWIKDKLIIIENIPAGVCPQCGEKVVRAEVGRWIAELIPDQKRVRKAKIMNVPVIKFTRHAA